MDRNVQMTEGWCGLRELFVVGSCTSGLLIEFIVRDSVVLLMSVGAVLRCVRVQLGRLLEHGRSGSSMCPLLCPQSESVANAFGPKCSNDHGPMGPVCLRTWG